MIIVQLTGGLGNQLFQYAFGKALINDSNQELLLDISSFSWDSLRDYALSPFSITSTIAEDKQLDFIKNQKEFRMKDRLFSYLNKKPLPYYLSSNIKEPDFNFDPNFHKYRKENVSFEGYWQSEKYFKSVRKQLLREISLDEVKFSTTMLSYLSKINEQNSVSIHIRRGDFLSNLETNAFHGVCDIEYYHKSIIYLKEKLNNLSFYIFSDDLNFVKEQFSQLDNCTFIEGLSHESEDLILMSRCKHHIIANSSFSWWGAWLNQYDEKTVIAPKIWFHNSLIQEKTMDLVPENWIRI
ncbi:MAG: alpha-1,2-fucosyltransferase [Bacteroidia bacterium]|nr:alpha-1,2-fucosyltransferase [Bacteroidia bacterium]